MSNRPLLVIIVLVIVAIGLAKFTSTMHPGGDLPPADKQADEDRQKAQDIQAETQARHDKVDHSPNAFDKVKDGAVQVTMNVEGRGTVVMEFYPKAAPQTVAHLTDLIKQKFYDGIKFHRIATSPAVVQVGDPATKEVDVDQFQAAHIGEHGSGKQVPLEISLPHVQWSVGMARSQQLDSGDSQFYINTAANSFLDGDYAVFGRVIQGQDVVSKIKIGDRITSMTVK